MNDSSVSAVGARKDAEVISVVGLAHAASHFFQLVLPPLFPWLMQDFSLSFTAAGMLMTVFFVVSGVGQAIAGFFVDRFGARPALLAGLGMLAAAAVVLGLAQDYPTLLLAAAIAGSGNAVFHPADYTLLNRLVSAKRLGHAFSAHGLTGTLGWAAAPVLMVGVAGPFGWRAAAFVAAGIAVLALVVLAQHKGIGPGPAHAAGDPAADAASPPAGAFAFLVSRNVWMCFVFFLMWTFAFSALQNFSPAVLSSMYGLSLSWAATAVTAYMLGNAVGTVGGGFLVNGASPDRAIAFGLFAAALIAILLATGQAPAAGVLPLMALMGLGAGLAGPSRDMLVRRSAVTGAGAASFGRIYGFVYSGLDTGLALSPILFGYFMDAGRFPEVMVGVAVFQALAILAAWRVGQGAAERGRFGTKEQ